MHAQAIAGIGPNALRRPFEVIAERHGEARARAILGAATDRDPQRWPDSLVSEDEVVRMHRGIIGAFDWTEGLEILRQAGERTGDYLLTHRIPQLAQRLLRLMPRWLALRALGAAIGRNAWTFAGSGRYAFTGGSPARIEIVNGPLARGLHAPCPACTFYAGTFERLVARIVDAGARVRETQCTAVGDPSCRFEIALPSRRWIRRGRAADGAPASPTPAG